MSDALYKIDQDISKLRYERRKLVEAKKKHRVVLRPLPETDNLSSEYINGLVQQRKKLGVSQSELGKAAGCTRANISNIELGKNGTSLEVFLRINNVLKMYEVRPLLSDVDVPPKEEE